MLLSPTDLIFRVRPRRKNVSPSQEPLWNETVLGGIAGKGEHSSTPSGGWLKFVSTSMLAYYLLSL